MIKSKMIFVIAISTVAIFVLLLLSCRNINMWKYSADFDSYKSDFYVVQEYVEKTATFEGEWFSVSTDKYGKALYSPKDDAYLNIPDDVKKSLQTICDFGFPDKDSVLDVIRIYGDKVFFCIENGRYALVYSPDEKPTWVNFPDEQGVVTVKKINEDWYHVVLVN